MKRTFKVKAWETVWKIELFPSPETLIDQGREILREEISSEGRPYPKIKGFTDKNYSVENYILDIDPDFDCEEDGYWLFAEIVSEAILDLNDIPDSDEVSVTIWFELWRDENFRNIFQDICKEIWLVLAKEPMRDYLI